MFRVEDDRMRRRSERRTVREGATRCPNAKQCTPAQRTVTRTPRRGISVYQPIPTPTPMLRSPLLVKAPLRLKVAEPFSFNTRW